MVFEAVNDRISNVQSLWKWIADVWTNSDDYHYLAHITLDYDTDDSVYVLLDAVSGIDYKTYRKIGLQVIVFNDGRLATLLCLQFPETVLTHK